MDNQEYLKQISQTVRPEKKSGRWMSSPILKVGIGGLVALIVIMIIGSILSSGKTSIQDQIVSLKLHIENTSSVISKYQTSLKSSDLRSSSASLSSVLSGTGRDISDYIERKYSKKSSSNKKLESEAAAHKDELEADLFEAKINGLLDRIYAHSMALEISLITAEESKIIKNSGDNDLKEMLTTSQNSLNNLYNNFNEFSETK